MVWGEQEVVNDLRTSLRVKELIPVRWSIKNTNLNGKGRVLNISTSGILLETPNVLADERAVFNIEMIKPNGVVLPQEGRMVWSKTKGLGSNRRLCGLEFVEPKQETVLQIREKIQKGIVKRASARRWQSVAGTSLMAVMMVLTAFVVRQYMENYSNTLQALELLSGSYEKQSALTQSYAQELATTKDLLIQAQVHLEEAKAEIGQLSEQNTQYQAKVAVLEQENNQLTAEMASLQQRLGFLEGDVKSLDEARRLISEYKGKFRLVKTKIKIFNREVFEAKVSAQKEKDRIAMLVGNNGYLVKDGKPNTPGTAPKIQIDVEIVK